MYLGILYLLLTFLFCFILVHIIKLAYIGIKSLNKAPEEIKKPAPPPEPVYYIVEKKRARKASYSEPKEFKFKK